MSYLYHQFPEKKDPASKKKDLSGKDLKSGTGSNKGNFSGDMKGFNRKGGPIVKKFPPGTTAEEMRVLGISASSAPASPNGRGGNADNRQASTRRGSATNNSTPHPRDTVFNNRDGSRRTVKTSTARPHGTADNRRSSTANMSNARSDSPANNSQDKRGGTNDDDKSSCKPQ